MTDKARPILLIDDEPDILQLLGMTFSRMGLETDTAADVSTAKALLKTRSYDLCLTDLRLPDGTGIDIVHFIQQSGKNLPVAVISAHGNMDTAIEALKAGAFDFIEKPFNDQHLIDRIQQAIDKSRSEQVEVQRRQEARSRLENLSRRERQVLDRIVAGLSNKQMARELEISIKTVETHRANLMSKMQVKSVSELVRLALIAGG